MRDEGGYSSSRPLKEFHGNDAVALWAGKDKGGENTRLGSKNHRPCRICGDRWHSEAECFKPGGGLDHLDRQGEEAPPDEPPPEGRKRDATYT